MSKRPQTAPNDNKNYKQNYKQNNITGASPLSIKQIIPILQLITFQRDQDLTESKKGQEAILLVSMLIYVFVC